MSFEKFLEQVREGDRVRHGRNFATVVRHEGTRLYLQWGHGLTEYYGEDLYRAHPLHRINRTPDEYVDSLVNALRANANARLFYFPMDRERRRVGSLRLGREVGYGLTMPGADAVIGSLYSRLIVQFCFDNVGVMLDAGEFVAAVREGQEKARSA